MASSGDWAKNACATFACSSVSIGAACAAGFPTCGGAVGEERKAEEDDFGRVVGWSWGAESACAATQYCTPTRLLFGATKMPAKRSQTGWLIERHMAFVFFLRLRRRRVVRLGFICQESSEMIKISFF